MSHCAAGLVQGQLWCCVWIPVGQGLIALPCPQPQALRRLTRLVLCPQEPGVFVQLSSSRNSARDRASPHISPVALGQAGPARSLKLSSDECPCSEAFDACWTRMRLEIQVCFPISAALRGTSGLLMQQAVLFLDARNGWCCINTNEGISGESVWTALGIKHWRMWQSKDPLESGFPML